MCTTFKRQQPNLSIFDNSMMAVKSGITKSQVKMAGVKIEFTGF